MIDWNSETWGGRVHYASDGSWVTDKHDDDSATSRAELHDQLWDR